MTFSFSFCCPGIELEKATGPEPELAERASSRGKACCGECTAAVWLFWMKGMSKLSSGLELRRYFPI